jgi:RNA polymerase sigma-70 factor (sigma-E family)
MNDEAGFRQFVSARWPALVQSAYLITLDRGIAEDCVQEALTQVHRRWRRLAKDNPEAYVRRSVMNAALSWRRRRRIREVPLEFAVSAAARTPASESMVDADEEVVAALRSLPPQMRAVVVLRYLEDRSEAETARLLGCSTGAVKSAASRGVARLRAALSPPEGPPRPPAMTTELLGRHYSEGTR